MDGDRLDSHLAAGAVNPKRDLPTIGDQNLFKHYSLSALSPEREQILQHYSISIRTAPNSTGCASATTICATRPGRWARIWFMTFMASMIKSGWPSVTA